MAIHAMRVEWGQMTYTEPDIEIPYDRYEMIDGVIYDMSPPPAERHERIAANLLREFAVCLKGKPCRVYGSHLGVWFRPEYRKEHVEPDLTVVCDPAKIQERGCVGAPDLIVEILSRDTAKKDRTVKLRKYAAEGVREYWIVDPVNSSIEVFWQEEGSRYGLPDVYALEDDESEKEFAVGIFPDLIIRLADVFE